MVNITGLHAREILDSRGNPTIEVALESGRGSFSAAVPAGASTGSHEAKELRDGDKVRFGGLGVSKAVSFVEGEIKDALVGKEFQQHSLDEALIRLDGTPDKARLGANALLGVSLAFARAAAAEVGAPLYRYIGSLAGNESVRLPVPMANVINGGKHARSGLALQEFMLVPVGFKNMSEALPALWAVIGCLREALLERGLEVGLGDEGGMAPKLATAEEALALLVASIERAGFSEKIKLAIDAAATSFFNGAAYAPTAGVAMSAAELSAWYASLAHNYPLLSIEDPFAEEAFADFAVLKKALPQTLVIGDDLTVTTVARVTQAARAGAVDGVIIKPNQAGTLTETLQAAETARAAGLGLVASHRSGETNDDFIADLAVGLSCEYFKAGSLARGERVAKYNRLLAIEHELSR
jgi:enolase